MAVGETVGPGAHGRRVVSAGGGRRRPAEEAVPVEGAPDEEAAEEAKPLVKEADPELERLLAEEEEIERRTRRAPRGAEVPRRRGLGRTPMLMPKKVRHRKTQRGRMSGDGQGWHAGALRRLRDPGARAGLDHEPPDRSRPYRDDPLHQAWREGVDQHLPGQARHPEAGRDPHGLGQGQPRALGRGREAGPRDVRAVGCARGRPPARPCASRCTSSRSRRASSCARRRHDQGEGAARAQRRRARAPAVARRRKSCSTCGSRTPPVSSTTARASARCASDIARIETLLREREIAAAEALGTEQETEDG